MELNAYLRLTGETQGEIKGSVTQVGQEDSIMVFAVNHEVTSPRDPTTGRVAGMRRHRPLVISKEIDRATPLLMNALVNNENIREFELGFWQPSPSTGRELQFYTIKLINASIDGIRFEMLDPEDRYHNEIEHVSF